MPSTARGCEQFVQQRRLLWILLAHCRSRVMCSAAPSAVHARRLPLALGRDFRVVLSTSGGAPRASQGCELRRPSSALLLLSLQPRRVAKAHLAPLARALVVLAAEAIG